MCSPAMPGVKHRELREGGLPESLGFNLFDYLTDLQSHITTNNIGKEGYISF